GQFVEITPEGWTVTSREGVPFETSSSTRPLPAPEQPNGQPSHPTLDTLRSTLNLGAPRSPGWLRCLAWLLAALRTHGPYPILILRGPSGCGKSLAARILRSIIDPSAAPFTPLPSSSRELLTLARLNWVLAFDHVSTLTPQIADTLCRLTSGVGVAYREPGHSEPLQLFLKRPIILTVTDRWTPPPDLAARALTVTLPPRSRGRHHNTASLSHNPRCPLHCREPCLGWPPATLLIRHPPRRRPRLGPSRRPRPELHRARNAPSLPLPGAIRPLRRCRPRPLGSHSSLERHRRRTPQAPAALPNPASPLQAASCVHPAAGRRRHRRPIPPPPRRRPGDPPVCVTKSPVIPATRSRKRAYPHTRNSPTSRILRHTIARSPSRCGAACQAARRLSTGATRGV